jgi:excisionase family DNA binding protein
MGLLNFPLDTVTNVTHTHCMEQLLTTAEAAHILGVSVATVHRMVERGDLVSVAKAPGVRGAYLFTDADVQRAAEGRAA